MKAWILAILLATSAAAQSPKLLVIDLDDLGREFLEIERPPFLNEFPLFARKYDRFYTSPVCTPTRASMHYGVRASHPDLQTPWLVGQQFAAHHTPVGGPLIPLARALSDSGRSCAKIGKWHLSAQHELLHPFKLGFDYYMGVMGNTSDYYSYTVNNNGVEEFQAGTYLTQFETNKAIEAMFAGYDFISLSYHAIHEPFHLPPSELYPSTIDTDGQVGQARAMLHALDSELARLSVIVRHLGYHVIMFCDNGGLPVLGGRKGSVLEGGINCSMWTYGPGVQPGYDESLIGVYDIYATALDFFGVPRTANMGPQSVSFLPTSFGVPGVRQTVYAERYLINGVDPALDAINWQRAVVGRDRKFRVKHGMITLHEIDPELFNLLGPLNVDPSDVEIATFLRGELDLWTD